MDAVSNVPQPVVLGLAAIGTAWAAVKLGSFVRVLLSLFILPGASVSRPRAPTPLFSRPRPH